MTNAELIQKIRAEIERRTYGEQGFNSEDAEYGYRSCARDLLSFLSTLESEKPVPNDLKEAAKAYALDTAEDSEQYSARYLGYKDGAKWQKQHDAELIEIAYNDGITIGMTKQKEQMMEEAEECELYWDGVSLAIDLNMAALGYYEGDKVRIIIVKEDCHE